METPIPQPAKPVVRKAGARIEKGMIAQCIKGKYLGSIGVIYDITTAEEGVGETLIQLYTQRPGANVEYWTAEITDLIPVAPAPPIRLMKHFPDGGKPIGPQPGAAPQRNQVMPPGITKETTLDELDERADAEADSRH